MINPKKKQITELGEFLETDVNGKYRTTLRDRIIALRRETEQKIKHEEKLEAIKSLEAMMRALMITDRILDTLLVSATHEMNGQSRVME